MIRKVFSGFLTIWAGSISIYSQNLQGPMLTLHDAICLALKNEPLLVRAEAEIKIQRARLERSRSGFFPYVNIGGIAKKGLSGAGGAFRLSGLAGSPQPDDLAVSGNIYYDLIDFGRRRHASQAHQHHLEALHEKVKGEKASIVLSVQRSYYRVLRIQKGSLSFTQTLVEEKELKVRKAEILLQAQIGSKFDLSVAQSELTKARLELTQATHQENHVLARLQRVVSQPAPKGGYLLQSPSISPVPPLSKEELQQNAREQRPEIRSSKAQIRAYESWLEKARSEKKPGLMAAFSSGFARFSEITLGKLLFGGLGLKLPIFNGGDLKAQIQEAVHTLNAAHSDKDVLLQEIYLQVETAWIQIQKTLNAIKTHEELYRHAVDQFRLVEILKATELSDAVELSVRATNVARTKMELAQQLYDYAAARAELDYAAGLTIGEFVDNK